MMSEMTQKQKMNAMLGILLGLFLAAMDSTIVGTAMPKVVLSLGGMEHYTWVSTAYLLFSTTSIPIFGKLADIYGRKIFFISGIAVFMMGSALCGLSVNMTELVIFRGLQGIGAGAMLSISFALVGDIFPPAERGKYQGVSSAVFGLASIVGPALGGLITDNLDWRWVFYVNIPIGVISIVCCMLTLPNMKADTARPGIDYPGVAALVLCIFPLLLAFSLAGKEYPWSSMEIIGLMAISALMLAVFLLVETKVRDPIIPLSLFKNSIFDISVAAQFLSTAGMFTAVMFMPLFVQRVVGASATNSGIITTPMMLSLLTASTISGLSISKTGRYKMIAVGGFVVMLAGMYMGTLMNTGTGRLQTTIIMILIGFGLGTTMPVFMIAVQNAFPHKQLGVVTSSVRFFGNVGGVISMAVMGSILNNRFASEFSSIITDMPVKQKNAIPRNILDVLISGNIQDINGMVANAGSFVKGNPEMLKAFKYAADGMKQALAVSIGNIYTFAVIVTAAALFICLFLNEIPLRKKNREDS